MPVYFLVIAIWIISASFGIWAAFLCSNGGRFGLRWLLAIVLLAGVCCWPIRYLLAGLRLASWLWILSYSLVPASIAWIATHYWLTQRLTPTRNPLTRKWYRPNARVNLLPSWMLGIIAYQVLFAVALVNSLFYFAEYQMSVGSLGWVAGTLHAGVVALTLVWIWRDFSAGSSHSLVHAVCCLHVAVALAMQGYALYACFHVVRQY